ECDFARLRDFLREKLPEYMVPAAFMNLPALPLTASGKADRKHLPAPVLEGESTGGHKARSDAEILLCTLFAQVLQLEQVGPNDNFFELGGDSILALQLIAQARAHGVILSVRDIFQSPDVEGLALRVAPLAESTLSGEAGETLDTSALRERFRKQYPQLETVLPLTPLQQGILFLSQEEKSAYQVQLKLRIEGDFDPERFRKAWEDILERHQALRVAIPLNETAFAVVCRKVALPFVLEDWQSLPQTQLQEKLDAFVEHERTQGFALDVAPLLKIAVVQVAEKTWEMLLTCHHIVLDGWSLALVVAEALHHYAGQPLPEAPSLSTYSAWLQSRPLAAALDWWRRKLEDFDTPNRIDLPVTAPQNGFGEETLVFTAEETFKLEQTARALRSTPSTFLQVLWAVLLGRLSDRDDVVFGNVVAGRPAELAGAERMVGMFINTVPVRLHIDAPVDELVRAATSFLSERPEYAPLHQVQAQASIPKGSSLFDTLFIYENYPVDERLFGKEAGFAITASEGIEAPPYPLTLTALPGKSLTLKLGYDRQRYDAQGAAHILLWLARMIRAALDNTAQLALGLPLLNEMERSQILYACNATQSTFPQEKTLPQLFEEQAARTPEALAVSDATKHLKYDELNALSNRIAFAVRSSLADIGRLHSGSQTLSQPIVGLCVERSVERVAALLGIHKAGCAYLPLDPRHPAERLDFELRDADVALVVSTRKQAACLPQGVARLLLDETDLERFSPENPSSLLAPTDLAYIIYTSGSTGRPKGVMVEQRGVVNRLCWLQRVLPYTPQDVILHKTPITFDVSVPELYGGWLGGAALHMLDPGAEKDPQRIAATIAERRITSIHFVASMLEAFLDHLEASPEDRAGCASLRRVFTSGEAVSKELVARFNRVLRPVAGASLHDLYGPTEASIEVSCYPCPQETPRIKTIGRAIDNTQLYILDRRGEPQPFGVPGELHIGGVQVARGYLNRPELTAERFIPNPFGEGRLYKTGDWARRLENGEIEYLGRIDQQVKIRGFRIELGEIEAAIRDFPGVRDVLVNPFGEKGHQRLCAYVVGDCDFAKLRSFLAGKLPDYMIPAAFMNLPALPLTASGKADRTSLPHPETVSHKEYRPPRTQSEETLCALCAKILGLERMGLDDHFFEAGGD
ncbi:MAG: amino acid adenylation domain-containing protein, partial [Deltaproteobacteria bacterium]|nr:amino acid adenylation domain-containing protein [Deltaproteobacteria bacterium]